jgi:hypothetical protein
MMDPDFTIGFADGEMTAQTALQQSGLVDLNPMTNATLATPPTDTESDVAPTL